MRFRMQSLAQGTGCGGAVYLGEHMVQLYGWGTTADGVSCAAWCGIFLGTSEARRVSHCRPKILRDTVTPFPRTLTH